MNVPNATGTGYESINRATIQTIGLLWESGASKRKILVYATNGHNKILKQASPVAPRHMKVIGFPYNANPFAYNALIWRHKRVGYTAKQSPRVCVPNICLLCVRDTCPSRLCRHRPLQQTVDLNNNNYLKTTLREKPDDKTPA